MRKFAIAAAVAASFFVTPAFAEYPEKTINYIIAFNAGGESDISARFQQPFFEKLTGQQAVIQYMAGAGGAQACRTRSCSPWKRMSDMKPMT